MSIVSLKKLVLQQFQLSNMQQVVGVNLRSGCNASLTSREAGDHGEPDGQKKSPVRTVKYERQSRTAVRHTQPVNYIVTITS